jgi:hypothetical protein
VTVGDPVTLTLQFSTPPDYRIGPLSWTSSEDTIVQVDSLKAEPEEGSKWKGDVRVALFAPGKHDVSPRSLLAIGPGGDSLKVIFARESVFVASVLPAGADSVQPADYKPIIQPPFAVPWWAWVLASAVALATAGLIWYRRRPRAAMAAVAKEIRSPWLVALDRLQELETEGYHLRGESRLFAIELSLIVRQYLERRYGFEAAEQTTTEIKLAMAHADMTKSQREAVLEALNSCDLAKYAKFHWPAPELENALKTARSFVIDTIPAPPPEARAA